MAKVFLIRTVANNGFRKIFLDYWDCLKFGYNNFVHLLKTRYFSWKNVQTQCKWKEYFHWIPCHKKSFVSIYIKMCWRRSVKLLDFAETCFQKYTLLFRATHTAHICGNTCELWTYATSRGKHHSRLLITWVQSRLKKHTVRAYWWEQLLLVYYQ